MKKFNVQSWIYIFVLGAFFQIQASDTGNMVVSNNSSKNSVEMRHYTYPPDYMRREPVINYPELSLSISGKSIKLPTSASINERGFLTGYWHNTNTDKLKYEGDGK
jgi:hypothetical protein